MNRLKKELTKRGIIYKDNNDSGYDLYSSEVDLVAVENNLIICAVYSDVVDPQFEVYDDKFNFIGVQDMKS